MLFFRNGQSPSSGAELINQFLDSMLCCKKISKNASENSTPVIKKETVYN